MRALLPTLAACLGAACLAPAALAAPTASEVSTPNARGGELAADGTGSMWLAQPTANTLVRVRGLVADLLPNLPILSAPTGVTAGPGGNVFYSYAGLLGSGLARMTPAGAATTVAVIAGTPSDVTAGPDGNLWLTVGGDLLNPPSVTKVVPGSSAVQYTLANGTDPHSIVTGPDGALWFLDRSTLVRQPAGGGARTTVPLPGAAAGLAATADALWYTRTSGAIGRVTTSGVVTEFTAGLPEGAAPTAIAPGPDGALWFTGTDLFGRVTPDGTITTSNAGLGSHPTGADIAPGPDGRMWMSFSDRNKVARITVPPLVGAPVAGVPTATGVAISVPLRPNGLSTSYAVEVRPAGASSWSRSTSYSAGSGTAVLPLALDVGDLVADTLYELRVVATNAAGEVAGAVTTLRTAVAPTLPGVTDPIVPVLPDLTLPDVTLPDLTGAVGVLAPGGAAAGPAPTPTPTPEPGATDDPEPAPPSVTPEPVLGQTVVVRADRGTVRVKVPGQGYVTLDATTTIPLNAVVDATEGRVVLSSQLTDGTTQTGHFSGGAFRLRQTRTAGGMTRLYLAGKLDCGRGSAAADTATTAAKRKRKKRRSLWGNDNGGNFQTNGRDSVATVRGTRWLTRDTCAGTLVKVTRGAVDVRPRGGGRTVRLTAGQSKLTPRR